MADSETDKKSYRQILKSTSITGGSSLIIIGFRIVRTKLLAVILGAAGVGLLGMYDSVANLASTATGLGIGSSGVRQIAEATGTDDQHRIARTVVCLRRLALFTGIAGLFLLLFLSRPLSRLTFGSQQHTADLALLSVTVLLAALSNGQTALIQGTRRIKELAMLGIYGALFGSLLSIPIIYIYGQQGIIPSLITVSAMNLLASWWYSRKMQVMKIAMSWRETLEEAKPLLTLGAAFMSSALMTAGTFYLLRVLIVRSLGLDEAGVYQAASGLSLLYTGFILEAMGRDFYPRLTAAARNNGECVSLMNKQMEIGLLLAVPGILATMTFAPYVITFFYSDRFLPAADVLRWQILGILLRVVTWPMAYIFLAKGNGKLFFWTELFANGIHLALVWFGIRVFGLVGTGMAFFAMYLLYGVLVYRIVTSSYGFALTRKNIQLLVACASATLLVFLSPFLFDPAAALMMNTGVTAAAVWYSTKAVLAIAGREAVPGFLLKLRSYFHA